MKTDPRFAPIIHGIRVGIVVALCLLIPSPRTEDVSLSDGSIAPRLDLLQSLLPSAVRINEAVDSDGFWRVFDATDQAIARVGSTLPIAADVVGYRGPTEAMVVIDDQFDLLGVRLIDSADTDEHVKAVRDDHKFFQQFESWKWQGPPGGQSIDGVSGATLTSLALAKGVLKRIGGRRSSLVFPDELEIAELSAWFPDARLLCPDGPSVLVMDGEGNILGRVFRTGPLADSIVGFQGPTELLLRLSDQTTENQGENQDSEDPVSAVPSSSNVSNIIGEIKIRTSFDNEPYVRYCRMERSFWKKLTGQTLESIGKIDLEAAGIEGVSGATMTSLAIAETVVIASNQWIQRTDEERALRQKTSIRGRISALVAEMQISAADIGCILLLIILFASKRLNLFRRRSFRWIWLATVIAIVGFWSGNLISLALIAGWGSAGIAWRLAPAMAVIAVVAFVAPLGKSNPYCNHLCPHGAIQQCLRPRGNSRRKLRLPGWLTKTLLWIPGTCLTAAYLGLLIRPNLDLASWEPFHAYLFRIAPWYSIGFALLTVAFASMVPMGYCRMGCPTGRLLDYLRRSAGSQRLTLADAMACGLLMVAVVVRLY